MDVFEDEEWTSIAVVCCLFTWDIERDRVEWSARDGSPRRATQASFLTSVHPDERDTLREAVSHSLARGVPFRCEVRVGAGRERWLTGRGVPRAGLLRGAFVDITSEREREVTRWSRLYAALSQINQAIVCATDGTALFSQICHALGEHGGFHMSWVGVHDPATGTIVPVASWGDDHDYLTSVRVAADDSAQGQGPTGTAFREGRNVISNDLLSAATALPWRDQLARRGIRASAVLPIRELGQVYGTLTVYADEVGFFGAKEMDLLEEAARNLSFALDNFARDRESQRAAETVRRERDFSDAVVRSLPGVLYLYDEHRRFLRWNHNFETFTGYSGEEIACLDPLAVVSVETRAEVARRIDAVFASGESAVEAELLSKSGVATPFHFTGVRTMIDDRPCLIGIGIDLSAQHEAERAQRETYARYRTLFDYAPDAILIADAKGTYLDANPGAGRMFGCTPQELVGCSREDILVPEQVASVADAMHEIKSSQGYRREWEFRRKDGSRFPGDVIAAELPDGNVLAWIRDITARKQAERAARELNENLERGIVERTRELNAALVRAEAADHLKSAFLASMSHELRTPLNSILGFAGILQSGMAGPVTTEQHKQLGMVRTSARHLLALINDVLDISKIEADQLTVQPTPFDLAETLERVVASVAPLASAKGLTLEARVGPEVGSLVSDRRRVEQILLNLINNAIKFTDKGGVTIHATRVVADVPLYRVQIVDTGIGIKPEDLATLFQPFRQIDTGLARRHEGTGLGLAICRRLATLLGGEVIASSRWGEGSMFTLTLPVARGAR